jgi:two-component system, NtrC family, sensor kinase
MNIKDMLNPKTIAGATLLNITLAIGAMAIIFIFFLTYKTQKQIKKTIEETEQRYTEFYKRIMSNDIKYVRNFIKDTRRNTEKKVRASIKDHVLNAFSIANHINSINKGTDQTQLMLEIKEALRPIHWGEKEFFFIIDDNGAFILNTDKPETETPVPTDQNQLAENMKMAQLVGKQDSGFYTFKKNSNTSSSDSYRIAFVKKFKPFNWTIGAGAFSDEAESSIKNEVLSRIAEMDNGASRYVFVLQDNGFCLYHPLKKFNKKFILDYTGDDGEKVIANLIDIAKNNKQSGYHQYQWENPSSGKVGPKMSFVTHIDNWKWTIGTGIYLEEMEKAIELEKKHYEKDLKSNIIAIILISLIAVILPLLIGIIMTRKFNESISTFIDFFKEAADSDTIIKMGKLKFQEFKFIGSMANQLVIDRMQKEIALEQSFIETSELKSLFKNVTDSMLSPLITVDMDMKVVQWNKRAEQLTGVLSQDAEGTFVEECFPFSGHEIDLIKKTLKTGKLSAEAKIKRTDTDSNEVRYEDILIFPLIADKINGGVIRIDDVTEKVKMEEMVIQSEKMLSVGGLAAGMAHEINNPLSGILTSTQVLENRLINDLPANNKAAEECGITFDAIKDYMNKRDLESVLENINSSGARAATIVSDMLSFSRKSDSVFIRCNILELMNKTIELAATDYDLKTRFDFKKIIITRHFDQSAPDIKCESSKIQQVFLNILINGAHAMAEVDDLPDPEFIISIKKKKNDLIIKVQDNGPGIPSDIRSRIFEPFFSTKEIGVGTGLGLSVSYFIITDQHKGTLEVESKKGKGTTFIIGIPI